MSTESNANIDTVLQGAADALHIAHNTGQLSYDDYVSHRDVLTKLYIPNLRHGVIEIPSGIDPDAVALVSIDQGATLIRGESFQKHLPIQSAQFNADLLDVFESSSRVARFLQTYEPRRKTVLEKPVNTRISLLPFCAGTVHVPEDIYTHPQPTGDLALHIVSAQPIVMIDPKILADHQHVMPGYIGHEAAHVVQAIDTVVGSGEPEHRQDDRDTCELYAYAIGALIDKVLAKYKPDMPQETVQMQIDMVRRLTCGPLEQYKMNDYMYDELGALGLLGSFDIGTGSNYSVQ